MLRIETLFPGMKTTEKDNPTGVTIMWDKPRDQVINQLTHYHVTYEVTKEAGYPVVNSSKVSVNVSAESKELPLDGFNTYSTYKIKVEAVSSDGRLQNNKILFAGTQSKTPMSSVYSTVEHTLTNFLSFSKKP